MSSSNPARATVPRPARTVKDGYRKGEETRIRLLDAALQSFGNRGFSLVTTREIVKAAGTTLPALTYYFGNKEGLYLACAQEIVASFRQGVGATSDVAAAALQRPLPAPEARDLLKRLFRALARFLLSSQMAQDRTLFVQREMASPGPAFEILYSQLWRPGIELAAELIGRAAGDERAGANHRVRAVMMIASLTGFRSGQRVIERTAGHGAHLDLVIAVIEEQIDALPWPSIPPGR